MPRFFFDIDDGENTSRDTEGTEFPDLETVRQEAISLLPDIAREELPDGNHRVFACRVRDHGGTEIFVATLTLDAGWNAGQGPSGS